MITVPAFSLLVWTLLALVFGAISVCWWLHKLGYSWQAVACYDCGGDVGKLGVVLVSKHTHDVLCDKCLDRDPPGWTEQWCSECQRATNQQALQDERGVTIFHTCVDGGHEIVERVLVAPVKDEREPACAGSLPVVLPRSCDHEQ